MPIGRLINDTPIIERLYTDLVSEWVEPSNTYSAPIIIDDVSEYKLYVIWDEFDNISFKDRNNIIIKSRLFLGKGLSSKTDIAGFTKKEAEKSGINYKVEEI